VCLADGIGGWSSYFACSLNHSYIYYNTMTTEHEHPPKGPMPDSYTQTNNRGNTFNSRLSGVGVGDLSRHYNVEQIIIDIRDSCYEWNQSFPSLVCCDIDPPQTDAPSGEKMTYLTALVNTCKLFIQVANVNTHLILKVSLHYPSYLEAVLGILTVSARSIRVEVCPASSTYTPECYVFCTDVFETCHSTLNSESLYRGLDVSNRGLFLMQYGEMLAYHLEQRDAGRVGIRCVSLIEPNLLHKIHSQVDYSFVAEIHSIHQISVSETYTVLLQQYRIPGEILTAWNDLSDTLTDGIARYKSCLAQHRRNNPIARHIEIDLRANKVPLRQKILHLEGLLYAINRISIFRTDIPVKITSEDVWQGYCRALGNDPVEYGNLGWYPPDAQHRRPGHWPGNQVLQQHPDEPYLHFKEGVQLIFAAYANIPTRRPVPDPYIWTDEVED